MKKLLRQKLSASIVYAIYTLLISLLILGVIGGLSYFKIWKFDFAKLPLFVYLVPLFLMNTFFYLIVASKDYFQDFGMNVESSHHRKTIKKATIFERIFNIILVFGILIGILYATRFLTTFLSTKGISVYYDRIGIFKESPLLGYIPEAFMIVSVCSLVFNSLIFLAYKFGAVKIFILFTAIIVAANVFLNSYLIAGFKFVRGLNMYIYLAIGLVALIFSILFTNFIKNLDVK